MFDAFISEPLLGFRAGRAWLYVLPELQALLNPHVPCPGELSQRRGCLPD